ncbi:hypothetical protein BDR04DRAFT_860741 [Suillus decipiens]|nr:hypothetical protein BDR04DRAFT_860741 [Suillus decipiens]
MRCGHKNECRPILLMLVLSCGRTSTSGAPACHRFRRALKSNGKRKMTKGVHSQGEHEKPTKRRKKVFFEGPDPLTTKLMKYLKDGTRTHGVPLTLSVQGIIPQKGTFRQPGPGDESGSRIAYPLPQVFLNLTPPAMPD